MAEQTAKREMVTEEDERPLPFHLMPQLASSRPKVVAPVPAMRQPQRQIMPTPQPQPQRQTVQLAQPAARPQPQPVQRAAAMPAPRQPNPTFEGIPSTHTLVEPLVIDVRQINGNFLRAFREARQLTVDDISAHTKVPKKYIMAIEADDYVNLPAPIYFRGFVIAYLREIGLSNNKQIIDFLTYTYNQRARR